MIEYHNDRKAFVDSETGEYMTFETADRESCHTYYHLHDVEGRGKVGAMIQEFVAEYDEARKFVRKQYFVREAWTPTASYGAQRKMMAATDPLIVRLGDFVRSHYLYGRREPWRYDFEFLVDYRGNMSLRELRSGNFHREKRM